MKVVLTETLNNIMKAKEITIIPKVIIWLTLGFGIKLCFSCTPHPQNPIEIDYNDISVIGIDNSDRYLNNSSAIDTLYSDAVALRLSLSDTSNYYAASFFPALRETFSFPTLKANDINPSYLPRNKVVDIKIKTLLDINDALKAGDDVSEHISCASGGDFDLYQNLSRGITWLNDTRSYYESSTIVLVLKASVKNTNAQFEVKVTLDNGNELLGTTKIFTIIES